jgi:small-conductance mechanosensitive channel
VNCQAEPWKRRYSSVSFLLLLGSRLSLILGHHHSTLVRSKRTDSYANRSITTEPRDVVVDSPHNFSGRRKKNICYTAMPSNKHQRFVLLLCWMISFAQGFVAAPRRLTQFSQPPNYIGRTLKATELHGAVKYVPRSPGTLALAGQIFSTMQKFVIGKSKAKKIVQALLLEGHIGDLAVLSILGFGAVPLMKYFRKLRFPDVTESCWIQSPACRVAISISQLCKIGGIVYAVDMLTVALSVIGFQFPMRMNLPIVAGQIGFAMWFAVNLAAVKQYLLCRLLHVKTADELGRSSVYDRMGNGVIYFTAMLVIMDILCVKTGRAVNSVFALGSVGTLVISLASKDIAANFVSGLALSASDKFHVGENVRIGDDYQGIVHRMGWMHTDIRGYDDIVTRIPNSEVATQKVSNISRVNRSQVKQILYFDYRDIDKVSKTIADIKTEIALSCPKLVTDESRPFWCHWREFKETKLEVVVHTHFTIRHGTTEYFDTRQSVLEAIARAARKNDVKFALPILSIRNGDGDGSALSVENIQRQTYPAAGSVVNESAMYPDPVHIIKDAVMQPGPMHLFNGGVINGSSIFN